VKTILKFTDLLVLMLAPVLLVAQADVIRKHNGEEIKGTVVKVNEYTIIFKYENEDAENTLSKYAIDQIIYGKSGRVEHVTDKIDIQGENDWDKVVILEDKAYTAGLTKSGEIRGQTAFINMQTGNTGDKKALKKLKMAAAGQGSPFILILSEKTTVGSTSNELGGSQAIKTGIAYKY